MNDTKPYGNILDFRSQSNEVDKAIALFSGKDNSSQAKEIWLVDPAPKVVEKLTQAVKELEKFMKSQGLECKPEEVSNLKGDVARCEFINKFKTVINGMNAAQQYYNIISQLEKVYKVRLEIETTGKDAATIEKEIEKKDRAATMSSIYNEIVADLAMHKISDYSTYNINGYTAYDAHDSEWSNLQYWDKPFGENDETMQSPVMAMSSILTTMTGKPFTPKLMIEKILPYIGHKMRDGAGTMPYIGTSQTTGGYQERFNFVPRNADQAKNFFGMDFITVML